MSSDSPALEDLEDDIIDTNIIQPKNSPVEDISNAIETILSEEHFNQKTNISQENEIGLIQLDVLQSHMLKSFNYEYPALSSLENSKQEHCVSVGGKRAEQIVDIFKSMITTIISDGSISPTSRLLGKNK
jgi:hypothetical protein